MTSFSLPNLRVYFRPWLHVSTGLVSVAAIIFLALATLIFQTCLSHYFHLQTELPQASLMVENLHQQKQRLEQFERAKKEKPHVFKTFEKKRFGHNLTPGTIQQYFQKWQKSHRRKTKVTTLSLKLGSQACQDAALNLWRIPVVVTLTVLKDSQVYDLLNYIQNQIPGKVILKQFSLKRTAALTPEMVKQIAAGKKDINLFEGKIEFDWIYVEAKN